MRRCFKLVKQLCTMLLDSKMAENENFIRFSFYELRVKNNLSEEDKQDFTNDDKKYIFRQVSEFIMSHSSKNGDIGRLQKEYEIIFRTINVK